MIREAFEYLVSLAKTEQFKFGKVDYTTKKLVPVQEPLAEPLKLSTLSGLVDYLKSNFDGVEKVIVRVDSHERVTCYSPLNVTADRSRYIVTEAQLPHMKFDSFLPAENFNIWMQSGFVRNEDAEIVLKVVGSIKEENVKEIGDDGISQAVTAKTGVSTVGNVKVPNPVRLAPYRTFVELEQPESAFVLRMQDGPRAALFEADGGAWRTEAMRRIKVYLQEYLSEEIESGMVTILA